MFKRIATTVEAQLISKDDYTDIINHFFENPLDPQNRWEFYTILRSSDLDTWKFCLSKFTNKITGETSVGTHIYDAIYFAMLELPNERSTIKTLIDLGNSLIPKLDPESVQINWQTYPEIVPIIDALEMVMLKLKENGLSGLNEDGIYQNLSNAFNTLKQSQYKPASFRGKLLGEILKRIGSDKNWTLFYIKQSASALGEVLRLANGIVNRDLDKVISSGTQLVRVYKDWKASRAQDWFDELTMIRDLISQSIEEGPAAFKVVLDAIEEDFPNYNPNTKYGLIDTLKTVSLYYSSAVKEAAVSFLGKSFINKDNSDIREVSIQCLLELLPAVPEALGAIHDLNVQEILKKDSILGKVTSKKNVLTKLIPDYPKLPETAPPHIRYIFDEKDQRHITAVLEKRRSQTSASVGLNQSISAHPKPTRHLAVTDNGHLTFKNLTITSGLEISTDGHGRVDCANSVIRNQGYFGLNSSGNSRTTFGQFSGLGDGAIVHVTVEKEATVSFEDAEF